MKRAFDDNADETARAKAKRTVGRRGLSGLANDTKWKEFYAGLRDLLSRMNFDEWPSWRFKPVDGEVSHWDRELQYHAPPAILVEWMDIAYLREVRDRRLPPNARTVDYRSPIVALLQRTGLEFECGQKHIRIFGYAPKSMELFDEDED